MYQFKESTNEEIETVITILVSIIMIFIPVGYILQDNDILSGKLFQNVTPAYMVICLAGVLLMMLLVMFFKKKNNRGIKLLDIAVLSVCFSLIISTIFSGETSISVVGVMYTQEGLIIDILLFVIMLSVSIIKSEKRRRIIFMVFLGVGVLEAVIGILQACFQFDLVSNYPGVLDAYRAYGTTTNANPYGAFMLLFASVSSGMFLMEDDGRKKPVYLALTVLYLYSMVLSGTRASMLGYLCMAPIALVLYVIYKKKNKSETAGNQAEKGWLMYVLYALLGIVGCVCVFVLNPNLTDTITRTVKDAGTSFTHFASGRGAIWKHAWNAFQEHPLIGVGVSNYRYVAYTTSVIDGQLVPDVYIAFIAHNEILDILANQGLLGFVTYLFLTVVMAVNALRIFFDENSKYNKKYSYAIILAMIAYFVNSMFGFRIIYVTPYIFVLYGLLLPREEMKHIKIRK